MPAAPTTWGSDPEFFGPRHAAREAMMLARLRARLGPPARVLDVGSGGGSLARLLASNGFEVVGVEPSEAFVAHARARAVAGCTFELGDVTRLGFADASFDAVVAGEVLEHVHDDERAVAELYRVLMPGGLALVTVPADPRAWDASDDWAGHLRRYEGGALRDLFERPGFEVLTLARWGFPLVGLYHRWVYLPMLARKRADRPAPPLVGWKRRVSRLLAWLFTVDRLFARSPWGIGYVLVARKPRG